MKHALTIAVCLLMLATVACRKRRVDPPPPPPPANELHYKETHCANPWDHETYRVIPESDTAAIKNWLLGKDITTLKVTITPPTDLATCKACTCLSTRIVKVVFKPEDIEEAKKLGFYKP